jgi:hypothetical protein
MRVHCINYQVTNLLGIFGTIMQGSTTNHILVGVKRILGIL